MESSTAFSVKHNKKVIQKKPTFKNILADPFSKFWPEITNASLKDFLAVIRKLTAADNDAKKEIRNKDGIVFGVSEIVRKLKAGELGAALFSVNLEPKFITRQIFALALGRKSDIKVICVPNLETVSEEVFGLRSYGIGLTGNDSESIFSELYNCILENAKRYPTPKKFRFQKETQIEPKRKPKSINLNASINFEELYLRKPADGSRAFVPLSQLNSPDDAMDTASVPNANSKQWSDFISFSESAQPFLVDDIQQEKYGLKAALSLKSTPDNVTANDSQIQVENAIEESEPKLFTKQKVKDANLITLSQQKGFKSRNQKKKVRKDKAKIKKGIDNQTTFQPTKIHKIQGNPKKVSKKKQKKNSKTG